MRYVLLSCGFIYLLTQRIHQFSRAPDALKYNQLLQYAKSTPDRLEIRRPENLVSGCQSQVWVNVGSEKGLALVELDADALITKGLCRLVEELLNGMDLQELVRADESLLTSLRIGQLLSPSRTNGLRNIFLRVQAEARNLLQFDGLQSV